MSCAVRAFGASSAEAWVVPATPNDYIEDVDLPDLPPSQLELLEGDDLMLLRNIKTRAGLAKGKRCRAQEMGLMRVVVKLDNNQECTFGRVRMEKTLDGVTFLRC
jgi:hypothetical protein